MATHPDRGRMLAILQLDAISPPIVERMLGEGRLPTLAGLAARGEWRTLQTPASYYTGATHPTLYSGVELGDHAQLLPLPMVARRAADPLSPLVRSPGVGLGAARAGRQAHARDRSLRRISAAWGSGCRPLRCPVLQLPRARAVGLAARCRASCPAVRRPQPLRGRGLRRAVAPWAAVAPPSARARAEPARRRGRRTARGAALVRPGLADLPHDAHRRAPVLGPVAARRGRARRIGAGAVPLDADGHVRGGRSPTRPCAACAPRGRRRDRALTGGDGGQHEQGRLSGSHAVGRARGHGARGASGHRPALAPARGRADTGAWSDNPWPGRDPRPCGHGATERRRCRLERTKAFVVPSDHHGQIRLNLRGRERDGIVDPSEADELCRRIADGLLSFRDEDGSQCVSGVDRAESIVGPDAPQLRQLPDLLVRWGETPSTRLQAVESPRFGRIERTGSGSGRSGGHTDDAFALLVPGRSRLATRNGDERVVDLTATACALLGGDMSGLAGTPLLEP